MGRTDYKRCRRCDASADDVGELSHTRLCPSCSRELLNENIDGLHTMTGPPVQRWRRGMAAAVGAVLLDDVTPSGHTAT